MKAYNMVDKNNAEVMLKYYIGLASKIGGTMIGVGTALTTGDKFFGPLIGTAIGHTLERVGLDIVERKLSGRQGIRVGRAYAVARMKLASLTDSGRNLRADGFFESEGGSTSPADEITEAILLAAMSSAEERKVDYIGSLIAYIAVNDSVDLETAQLMVETANNMTFRSMTILKIVTEKDRFVFGPRPGEGATEPTHNLHPVMIEIYNLARNGTVEMKDRFEDTDSFALSGFDEVDPARMFPTSFGELLYEALDLQSMDLADRYLVRNVSLLDELSKRSVSTSIAGSSVRAVATEPIERGALVNIYEEESGAKVRKADFRKKQAVSGFVRRDCSAGEEVAIFTSGEIRSYRALEPGRTYFLGEEGRISEISVEESNTYSQTVGQATTASILSFVIGDPILRA